MNRSTITRAIQDVWHLLDQHGHTITPSTARFRTPADLMAYLTSSDPKP